MFFFSGKPKSINWFMTPFVDEFIAIREKGGIIINGKKTDVQIRCFICDTPARAALKGEFDFCNLVFSFSYILYNYFYLFFKRCRCE